MSEEEEEIDLCQYYSVGSYGVFPIRFFRIGNEYFYAPQESDAEGPFNSQEDAISNAEWSFSTAAGSIWQTIEEAEKHVDRMRDEGYSVE